MADIDVLLPVKRPNFPWLLECLRSIQDQIGLEPRLIAVVHPDDWQIQDFFSNVAIEVLVLSAPEHGNLADALNVGLNACRTPFVARIDADDVAEPHRLAQQLEELRKDANCAVLGSSATLIDEFSRVIGVRQVPTEPKVILNQMRWRSAVIHPSVVVRRSVIEAVGGYSTLAENVEDYELWLRVLQRATIRSLPEALIRYRVHPSQVTKSSRVDRAAIEKVLTSRLDLARNRRESSTAARARHALWGAWQTRERLLTRPRWM